MRHAGITLLLLASLAAPAAAHEFWLAPSTYAAARGDTVQVRAFVGTGFRGELKPFAASRVVRFALRVAGDHDLARAARNGDAVMARFVTADAGGALVAYQSGFAEIELDAPTFERYLVEEGLDAARARRARRSTAAARERYARCPKTWVAGSDPSRVTRPLGLTYELVPTREPGAGGALSVRALFRGRPLSGALVRAWRRPLERGARPFDAAGRDSVPALRAARTGPDGTVTLKLEGRGEWLLSSVHMIPSADRTIADWESYWASLTFARLEP